MLGSKSVASKSNDSHHRDIFQTKSLSSILMCDDLYYMFGFIRCAVFQFTHRADVRSFVIILRCCTSANANVQQLRMSLHIFGQVNSRRTIRANQHRPLRSQSNTAYDKIPKTHIGTWMRTRPRSTTWASPTITETLWFICLGWWWCFLFLDSAALDIGSRSVVLVIDAQRIGFGNRCERSM